MFVTGISVHLLFVERVTFLLEDHLYNGQNVNFWGCYNLFYLGNHEMKLKFLHNHRISFFLVSQNNYSSMVQFYFKNMQKAKTIMTP